MANGRQLANPPVFTPLPFGLLSAATDSTATAPQHWRAGITWQSHCPGADGTYDPCQALSAEGAVPDAPLKTPTTEFLLRGATAFTVYAKFQCSPVGFWDTANQLATEALTRVEGFEAERIFESGVAPRVGGSTETVYPHLQANAELVDDSDALLQSSADVITTTPLDATEAFGRIEAALAECYNGVGVLHVPAILSGEIQARALAQARGSQLTTLMGNRVALGAGYSGAAPDGTVTDSVAWVYATGNVFYYRGEINVMDPNEIFDRSINSVEAMAERTYLFGWDCCHLAIPVYIGGIPAGEYNSAGPFTGG
jgi:hypothetical protein